MADSTLSRVVGFDYIYMQHNSITDRLASRLLFDLWEI